MMKEEQYMYICCLQHLYRINLSEFGSSSSAAAATSSSSLSSSLNKPLLEMVVDFVKEELPIGTGFFVVDDDNDNDEDDEDDDVMDEKDHPSKKKKKLYMLGGEILQKGDTADGYVLGGSSRDIYRGQPPVVWRTLFNDNIFSYDSMSSSNHGGCGFHISDVIPKIKAPKPNPIIATIHGKIYVLAGLAYYYRPDISDLSTSFEVYDPASKPWEALPDFPLGTWLCSHFVFGSKLYIFTVVGQVFSFDVNTRVWKNIKSILNDFGTLKAPYIGQCTAHSAEFNNGLLVAFARDKLVVYRFDDKLDELLEFRVLDELRELCEPFWEDSKGFVLHMGKGKMVFFLFGYNPNNAIPHPYLLRVSTFQFQVVTGDHIIPTACVLTNHVYDTEELPDDIYELHHVFTMTQLSRKRRSNSVNLDSCLKKEVKIC